MPIISAKTKINPECKGKNNAGIRHYKLPKIELIKQTVKTPTMKPRNNINLIMIKTPNRHNCHLKYTL